MRGKKEGGRGLDFLPYDMLKYPKQYQANCMCKTRKGHKVSPTMALFYIATT